MFWLQDATGIPDKHCGRCLACHTGSTWGLYFRHRKVCSRFFLAKSHSMKYIGLSTVGIREYHHHMLCTAIGIEPGGSKPSIFRAVQEHLYYLYHEKRKTLCLAIDECQYLSPAILNDL